MNIRHLEHFVAVVEHGGYRPAAQALGLTQPALTKSVAALEADLDVSLLARARGKAPSVTVFGRVVYDRGVKLLEEFSDARRSIERLRDGYAGDVRIGFGATLAASRIAKIAAELQNRLPESMVHVRRGLRHQLLPQLRSGRLDFLIMSGVDALQMDDLHVAALWRDPFCVFTGAHHERASYDVYDKAWADAYPWLSSERLVAVGGLAATYLGHDAKTIQPARFDVFDPTIVARILTQGDYMSAWPSLSFEDEVARGDLKAMTIPPVDGEPWMSETSVIYRKGVAASTAVQSAWRIVQGMAPPLSAG